MIVNEIVIRNDQTLIEWGPAGVLRRRFGGGLK
jgi:hypothetical protein